MNAGRCPKCGQWVPVNRDGTVKDHDSDGTVREPYDGTCAGARFVPDEVRS